MASEADDGGTTVLAPDDAFAALGNDTRVRILEHLGEADEPLAFSELCDRVGVADSAQFNYHLDKLVDHFVAKTEAGYELRRAGRRVVEAILSGAVTDDPVLDRTEIDQVCPYCDAPVEVRYREERVETYCTACAGTYGGSEDAESGAEKDSDAHDYGYLGYYPLPPAGLRDRTPTEVHRAAHTWNMAERLPAATGVCPRCSAPLDESVVVCATHDADGGLCGECGRRHAAEHVAECTNCIFSQRGAFVVALLADTDLLAFLTAHGVNPITPSAGAVTATVMDYEEEILEAEPFEARFTFSIDGDTITLTVDDELSVVDVSRRSETAGEGQ